MRAPLEARVRWTSARIAELDGRLLLRVRVIRIDLAGHDRRAQDDTTTEYMMPVCDVKKRKERNSAGGAPDSFVPPRASSGVAG